MFDWKTLLDEAALQSVLPGDYARFARPVSEGLIVFLEGLPEAYQAKILTQQAALPLSAGISQRLALLARSCPVLHKLGQVLARNQRLAPELRQHLQGLESLSPSVPDATIRDILAHEFGPLDRHGVQLVPPAIAEASVAVVVPFVQTAVHEDDPLRHGVFKILKPGIEERLALELELLGRVGLHLDEQCQRLGLPRIDYAEIFEQIREKLSSEIRLDAEQRHLASAADFFADQPHVHIPALLQHCTPRVTAMQRINGVKITDHTLNAPHRRRQLAELVVQSLVTRPVFSRAARAMFHSDPHAGNLFLTDQNRLAILDWSLVGSLGDGERVAIVQIVQAAIMLNGERIVSMLESLGERRQVDRRALAMVVGNHLRQVRRGTLPGLSWLVGLLDDAVQTARLRVAADLMLFRKSLHTLEGVIAELGAEAPRMDEILLTDFIRHFAAEWPWRWVTSPTSRNFATRLSSFDLAETLWSCPSAMARFWMGHGLDLLEACGSTGKLQV